MIDKYSWADFKKSVKVYVEREGIDDLPEENIKLEYVPNDSFLKIRLLSLGANGEDFELVLAKLHDKIKKATFKKKDNNRLVISLQKLDDTTWYELQQK